MKKTLEEMAYEAVNNARALGIATHWIHRAMIFLDYLRKYRTFIRRGAPRCASSVWMLKESPKCSRGCFL